MPPEVETRSLDDQATAARPYTVIIDRPASAGGGGVGLNGAELLYLAAAGCVSNDLFRAAQAIGIALRRVRVRAVTSPEILSTVGDVDRIAKIPNSLRGGTQVRLTGTSAVRTAT